MPTVQDSIHAHILETCRACLVSQGYTTQADPDDAADNVAVLVYDEYAMLAWPPPMPDNPVNIPPLTLVLQPGAEMEERPAVTNADKWSQEILVGFTVGASPPATRLASGSSTLPEAWAKVLKTALVKALRTDRYRGGIADDTRDFTMAPWTWGNETGCGYSIGFKVTWRTNYNDPDTAG